MTRIRVDDLHKNWIKDPKYRREYEALEKEFSLVSALIEARTRAGLTQEQLARRMKTTQAVIARLEGGGSKPSTRTLERYAEATKSRLRITFEPEAHGLNALCGIRIFESIRESSCELLREEQYGLHQQL